MVEYKYIKTKKILGKDRRVYKKKGSNKEYLKKKDRMVAVSDYKKNQKGKKVGGAPGEISDIVKVKVIYIKDGNKNSIKIYPYGSNDKPVMNYNDFVLQCTDCNIRTSSFSSKDSFPVEYKFKFIKKNDVPTGDAFKDQEDWIKRNTQEVEGIATCDSLLSNYHLPDDKVIDDLVGFDKTFSIILDCDIKKISGYFSRTKEVECESIKKLIQNPSNIKPIVPSYYKVRGSDHFVIMTPRHFSTKKDIQKMEDLIDKSRTDTKFSMTRWKDNGYTYGLNAAKTLAALPVGTAALAGVAVGDVLTKAATFIPGAPTTLTQRYQNNAKKKMEEGYDIFKKFGTNPYNPGDYKPPTDRLSVLRTQSPQYGTIAPHPQFGIMGPPGPPIYLNQGLYGSTVPPNPVYGNRMPSSVLTVRGGKKMRKPKAAKKPKAVKKPKAAKKPKKVKKTKKN